VSKSPDFRFFRPSSEKASRALAKIKGADTKGEQLLRSTLWKLGFRFRKNVRNLPGKPDIVFPSERIIVFCDGDFWHGRNWKKDKKRLKAGPNSPYWVAKIQANINRDKRYNRELRALGWTVLRYWESDVRADTYRIAQEISDAILSKR
jgi:DNA mismatch endonuclease (patch repair protein)